MNRTPRTLGPARGFKPRCRPFSGTFLVRCAPLDSNQDRGALQAPALPLELGTLDRRVGFEPTYDGVATRPIAMLSHRLWSPVRGSNPTDRIKSPVDRQLSLRAVPPAGIEPAQTRLKGGNPDHSGVRGM